MKAFHFSIALLSSVILSGCTMSQDSSQTSLPIVPKTITVSGTMMPKTIIAEPVATGSISSQSFSGNLK